jgi:hypothetical protein
MKKKTKQRTWTTAAVILAIAAVIDIFVPDPIAFIDEVILIAGALGAYIWAVK